MNRGHTKTTCLMKVQDAPEQQGPGLTWQLQETHLSSGHVITDGTVT